MLKLASRSLHNHEDELQLSGTRIEHGRVGKRAPRNVARDRAFRDANRNGGAIIVDNNSLCDVFDFLS